MIDFRMSYVQILLVVCGYFSTFYVNCNPNGLAVRLAAASVRIWKPSSANGGSGGVWPGCVGKGADTFAICSRV